MDIRDKILSPQIFRAQTVLKRNEYFVESMLPKPKPNKAKTFRSMDPIHSRLDKSVIDRFIEQQDSMIKLLEISKNKNLNRIRIPVSISKLIKLKLGDTFRFVIYHNIRHIQQIKNIPARPI